MTRPATDHRRHLTDPEVMECPLAYYAELHADVCPVRDEGQAGWIVPGYRDLVALSHHPALSNEFHGPDGMKLMGISPEPFSPQVQELVASMHPMANVMLFSDPPIHTRTKMLSAKALNPTRVREMAPRIQQIVDTLIDSFADDEKCDLMNQFAVPLPAHLMGGLLGMDTADIADFTRWVEHTVMGVGDALDNEQRLVVGRSVMEFQDYLLNQIEQRRGSRTDDLLDAIIHAELTLEDLDADGAEIAGPRRLEQSEILSIVIQLLGGGNHTTTQLICLSVANLLRYPEVMAEVRADPTLVTNVLEETLRLSSRSSSADESSRPPSRSATPRSRQVPRWASPGARPGSTPRSSLSLSVSTSTGRTCASTCPSDTVDTSAWARTSRAPRRQSRCRPCWNGSPIYGSRKARCSPTSRPSPSPGWSPSPSRSGVRVSLSG